MAEISDDLLDGELLGDEGDFGELDGDQEDALLADVDYDGYEISKETVQREIFIESGNTRQKTSAQHSQEIYNAVEEVQDVAEGEEILEDEEEEDVLELGDVEELESELQDGGGSVPGNTHVWKKQDKIGDSADEMVAESTSAFESVDTQVMHTSNQAKDIVDQTTNLRVSSSTISGRTQGGESDEDDNNEGRDRFKTERTTIISLKNRAGNGKSLADIPDSLDNVVPVQHVLPGNRYGNRGAMNRGNWRGRGARGGRGGAMIQQLPFQRGALHGPRGFQPPGPQTQNIMRPPFPVQRGALRPPGPHNMQASHKILINPHFRGPAPDGRSGWETDVQQAQPLPPGDVHPCQQQIGAPIQSVVYTEQYQQRIPQIISSIPNNPPGRMVHFSNDGLVTVETEQQPYQHDFCRGYDNNRNIQYPGPNGRPGFEQANPPYQSQIQPQNSYSNRVVSMPQQNFDGPGFPSYSVPNQKLEFHEFTDLSGTFSNEYQGFDANQNSMQHFQNNNWGQPHVMYKDQQQQYFYSEDHQQHVPPQMFIPHPGPQHTSQRPLPPQRFGPTFTQTNRAVFRGGIRGGRGRGVDLRPPLKRIIDNSNAGMNIIPFKQTKFENNKNRKGPVMSNLHEVQTVDNLPDTTTATLPEPEEEDEETRQYRLKIDEQKRLREKILQRKEVRRQMAAVEKQKEMLKKKDEELIIADRQAAGDAPPGTTEVILPSQQRPNLMKPNMPGDMQGIRKPSVGMAQRGVLRQGMIIQQRGRGIIRRGNVHQRIGLPIVSSDMGVNRVVSTPQRQVIQDVTSQQPIAQPAAYKIVRVRTKEGSIEVRKTPVNADGQPIITRSVSKTDSPVAQQQTQHPQTVTGRRLVINNMPRFQHSANTQMRGSFVSNRGIITVSRVGFVKGVGRGNTTVSSASVVTPSVEVFPSTSKQPLTVGQRFALQANQQKVQSQDASPSKSNRVVMPPDLQAAITNNVPIPNSCLVTVDNLSASTTKAQIVKMARQVGDIQTVKLEPKLKRATLRFREASSAGAFFKKFQRKMVDLSMINVTVVPE